MKAVIVFIFFIIHISHTVDCIYRKESHSIFDRNINMDILQKFGQHERTKQCNPKDGPFCLFAERSNFLSESENFKEAIKIVRQVDGLALTADNVYKHLKSEDDKFRTRNRKNLSQNFNFAPRVVFSLLMTFESFDEQTKHKDVYMPEERVINFNSGHIKINFMGKLRLTSEKHSGSKVKNDEVPNKTFGIVEDKNLVIKFDKQVVVGYVFVRPHLTPEEPTLGSILFSLAGYNQGVKEIEHQAFIDRSTKNWTKIIISEKPITSLQLPPKFEYDNLKIAHDTLFNEENTESNIGHMQNYIKSIMDDVKRIKEEEYDNDDL